ncbi:protein MpPP2C_A2 [Marchantia polymorpha subsp. ruderalis]|uniref:PPM-type phosphatase domain-containing protein n=2 Tax=Marchantia polymorpha TaxID=3197 RepID=A0AAF6BHD3_MARPO|nr:hypothetical protein MARPO_3078s0001 [Marchantia polymorpha]BBN11417.1 hypothetical protein Mp_5g11710 [Marchantia polymorpha subsp. ruderalis]|eukprot:PTQ26306.1 hypothetical protein MARPO_3078s0001 [Marchantia polymorpha]
MLVSSVSFISCNILDGPSWGVACADEEGSHVDNQAVAVPTLLSLPTDDNQCDSQSTNPGHPSVHYFAVFDGNGDSVAADLCKGRLHEIVAEEVKRQLDEDEEDCHPLFCYYKFFCEPIQRGIRNSFLRMHDEVVSYRLEDDELPDPMELPIMRGASATVAIVTTCRILVANCGNARVVLSKGGKVIQISNDHILDRDDEKVRLRGLGFPIGDLSTVTRSLGCRRVHDDNTPIYLIPEPEFTFEMRSKDDECLIIASHGLWKVISNEVACEVVRTFLAMGATAETTAIFLAQMAKESRAEGAESFSESVIVVDLRPGKVQNGQDESAMDYFEGTTATFFEGRLRSPLLELRAVNRRSGSKDVSYFSRNRPPN